VLLNMFLWFRVVECNAIQGMERAVRFWSLFSGNYLDLLIETVGIDGDGMGIVWVRGKEEIIEGSADKEVVVGRFLCSLK
jgi:hypothetical protein